MSVKVPYESVKLRSSSLFVTYIHVNSKILFHQKLTIICRLINLLNYLESTKFVGVQ